MEIGRGAGRGGPSPPELPRPHQAAVDVAEVVEVEATLPATGLPTGRLLTAFALMGVGLGLASTASTAVGTEAAPADHRGVASGLLSATAQIGTALGIALVAPLAAVSGAADPAGMRWGCAAAGVIAVLGLAGSRLLPAAHHFAERADARAA